MIAALFVQRDGAYWNLDGVEPWDEARDARRYNGPWSVAAHPPCERWGRFWYGGPSVKERRQLGDDGGCFASALASVRCWGGVLEHPAGSQAWRVFGLHFPPASGGWVMADFEGGWTCQVEQGHYGHMARKATWLYAVGCELPSLRWGSSGQRLPAYAVEKYGRRKASRIGMLATLSSSDPRRAATPIEFRDILIAMAASAAKAEAA